MEEYQPRKQSPQVYPTSRNLAQQPYAFTDQDDFPLEEDATVVPLPKSGSIDGVAEDPLQPRSPGKRKQSSSGKGRSTTSKKTSAKTSAKTLRPSQVAKHTPFADELQQLEEMADRINQILAERSQRRHWAEQSQTMPPTMAEQSSQELFTQSYPQSQKPAAREPGAQPSLENEETKNLKQQAQQIRKRLSELEAFMEEVEEEEKLPLEPPANSRLASTNFDDYQPRNQPPEPPQNSGSSQNYQSGYSQPSQPRTQPTQRVQSPPPFQADPSSPMEQQSEYEAWLASEELRRLQRQEQPPARSPASPNARRYQEQEAGHQNTIRNSGYRNPSHREHLRPRRSSFESAIRHHFLTWLPPLQSWRIFAPPQKSINRIGDAAVWIVAAIVVRVSSRYFLLAFPSLTPIFTLLMLTPAAIAVLLVLFAPRTGWVPLYRLLLIMLGLLIGGKF